MATAMLVRRVRFAAAHRYFRPEWSAERNASTFGACANPHFHGHGYICDVTVRGTINEETGMIVDLALLDRILGAEIVARFDHRNINLDVPEFADGQLVPTSENLARFIFQRLRVALGDAVAVERVTIHEDETLRAEYTGE